MGRDTCTHTRIYEQTRDTTTTMMMTMMMMMVVAVVAAQFSNHVAAALHPWMQINELPYVLSSIP